MQGPLDSAGWVCLFNSLIVCLCFRFTIYAHRSPKNGLDLFIPNDEKSKRIRLAHPKTHTRTHIASTCCNKRKERQQTPNHPKPNFKHFEVAPKHQFSSKTSEKLPLPHPTSLFVTKVSGSSPLHHPRCWRHRRARCGK